MVCEQPRHRSGPAEEITLEGATAIAGEEIPLRLGFHALGDDPQTQALRQGDDGPGDGGVADVVQQIPDETLVDLQFVERQALEIRQGANRQAGRVG